MSLFGGGRGAEGVDVLLKLHNIFLILFLLEETHLFTISPEVSPDIPTRCFSLELIVFWSEGGVFCLFVFFIIQAAS